MYEFMLLGIKAGIRGYRQITGIRTSIVRSRWHTNWICQTQNGRSG